jgi:hypothetical protein
MLPDQRLSKRRNHRRKRFPLSNQKDHYQKAALASEEEESPSSELSEHSEEANPPIEEHRAEAPSEALPDPLPPAPTTSSRPPRYIVDEEHEVMASVGPTTVIFRPRQSLSSLHMLELARLNNIAIKEV